MRGMCAGAAAYVVLAALAAHATDRQVVALPPVVAVGDPSALGVPASVDRIDTDSVTARTSLGVSEVLRRMPGVVARDRQNLAQDVQVTIRGFGARSTFGVRGLRLYVDGIPASMPDGQGQVSHVPLAALSSVEVLRGPFSALYGNASGGVIQFFSKEPATVPALEVDASAGSDATRRLDLAVTGPWSDPGAGGYRLDAGRLRTDGYRDHSRARRDMAQARLVGEWGDATRLSLTANGMDLEAQDPQGLTLEHAHEDPRAASAGALRFDTRKQVRQRQAGLRLESPLPVGTLAFGLHGGRRGTWQMLSIPAFVQAVPGSGGGVIDLDRRYSGLDARWSVHGRGDTLALTVGIELQRSREHRLGYENFRGDTMGVIGALRRDQHDRAGNDDVFAEARWRFQPRWQATLGMRHSRVSFRSHDHYIATGNPDDSGALAHAFTTPVAGLLFQPDARLDVYFNAGRGYETPTASELAYRLDGASGLNPDLRPSRTQGSELGLRWHDAARQLGLAVFDSRTRDEIVVAASEGGRSVYANATSTRRRGLEASASGNLGAHWRYGLAWTTLDARYGDSGNRIPGTAARTGWGELRWSPRGNFVGPGVEVFVSGTGNSRIAANDDNSAWAPGHARFDLGAERRWRTGRSDWTAFLRIDNVFDRRAIGSVIVNDGNGRYFEPAPGRGVMLGLRVVGGAAGP